MPNRRVPYLRPMKNLLIKGAQVVNEGRIELRDVLVEGARIAQIAPQITAQTAEEIDARGLFLLPGLIDGQVHFREPGLTHKGDIASESAAAVAGGITSYLEMPNTRPQTLSRARQANKNQDARGRSWANYAFLLGVNGENMEAVLADDLSDQLAVTDDGLYFEGPGHLLADHPDRLAKVLAHSSVPVAIHAEKEQLVGANEARYRAQYGPAVPFACHPLIRSEAACYEATREAIARAEEEGGRLHILHLSTAREARLFAPARPGVEKRITTEASIHHLWFNDQDYQRLGARIKWNPAIKTEEDRQGLLQALREDRIDLITTDHAPHAWPEKEGNYFESLSGAPMVQHALVVLLELYHRGALTLEQIVKKTAHAPAALYGIAERGYLRKGYYADLTLVDLDRPWTVEAANLRYKCAWSPLEGQRFQSQVRHTVVNGEWVYRAGRLAGVPRGEALTREGAP